MVRKHQLKNFENKVIVVVKAKVAADIPQYSGLQEKNKI